MSKDNKEALAKKLADQMTKGAISEAKDFIDGFMNEVSEPNPRIPENVFTELFLPHFAATTPEAEKNLGNAIAHWIGLVGASSEVDLVNPKGETVITIPPIISHEQIKAESFRTDSKSIRHIFQQLSDQSAIHAQTAMHEFSQVSAERLNDLQANTPEDKEGWRKVFERYNLVPKEEQRQDIKAADDDLSDFSFE